MLDEYLDQIVKGNCISVMKAIPDESIDMIFADPPYNNAITKPLLAPRKTVYVGVMDKWDRYESPSEFKEFTEEWIAQARRILKPRGTIWITGNYHNIFLCGYTLQCQNFWILNDIVWQKEHSIPEFSGRRFTPNVEYMIWAKKNNKTSYTFNYHTIKVLNDNKLPQSVWKIPICQGTERLKDEQHKKVHSTQKPEKLLFNVIIASTNKDDIVLDPFSGTGTTCAVAKKLSRHFIGIEQNKKYVDYSRLRIQKITPANNDVISNIYDVKPPKVTIQQLLEAKIIEPNITLYTPEKIPVARLLDNGDLLFMDKAVKFHRLAEKLQNIISGNAWKYFYVKQSDNTFVLIGKYRDRMDSAVASDA